MGVHAVTLPGWLSPRGRVLARAGIGVLGWVVAPDLADEVVGDGLAWEQRLRVLPSRLAVYFIVGLCLFSDLPYGQVLRQLTAGLEDALAGVGWRVPAVTALTRARRRVGEVPLESLLRRLCSALSPGRAAWSHVCGLLVVAWDGTTVTVPASPENIAVFGRPGRNGGEGHYPQARLVSLLACGTRGLLGAAIGPVRGRGSGEGALAARLLDRLAPGMLLLADRNFYSWGLWHAAAARADLLWRVKSSMLLPATRMLPDGSWLAVLRDPRAVHARLHKNGQRRRRGSKLCPDTSPLPGTTVRVIEFWVTATSQHDGRTRTEPYRVITTLTDWRACPAAGLAAAYGWRWAIETGYAEFKTYLRGAGRILRSRDPALARQELWAYLTLYQAIRTIIAWAAAGRGLDPDQISFTTTLHTLRRTLPAAHTHLPTALAAAEAEITTTLVPKRPGRVWVRALTRPGSYPSRRSIPGPLTQNVSYTITTTPPTPTTHTPADQQQHPKTPPNHPP